MGIEKMVEESPPEFKFSSDEQDPETFYQEEIKDLQVEKLSQKVTLLTILLPILIGIAIFFAYRDLTGRVSRTQDTGSMEVQRVSRQLTELSKEFNDKLITFSTTLSTQDKEFDTTVSEKLTAVNKNLKSLNQNLTQTRSTVKNLAASKADKKSQDAAFAKINGSLKSLENGLKSVAKLRQELKVVSSAIKSLEGDMNQKITVVTTASEQSLKDYSQLQTSVAGLSDEKVDKDTFNLEVFKLKKNFQNSVAQEITAINQKLDAIQKNIDGIQKSNRSQKRSMKSLSKKTSPAQSTGPTEVTIPSKSGSIDEQDLLE